MHTKVHREKVRKLEAYVEEIASDEIIPGNVNPEGPG